jgi:hypothetical protein
MRKRLQCGWFCQAPESVRGPAGRRERSVIINDRRIAGLFGAVGAVAAGTEIARAQDELGDSIANTVSSAVSTIATNSSVSGGESVESSEVHLGERTGLAIADASGGSNNIAFVS